ncbi:AAA family ATPase [Capilliphycus salinus ALCB114379]|uniref:AAA family ATPase n=1 Tax=Capilliphycus salinus TaxID=2768948 RepID=UPI0039A49EEA
MKTNQLICHFIIGVSGAGKSTFAARLATLGNFALISTDNIRSQLYGNEITQGQWHEIEMEVLRQVQENVALGKPVIYDATNTKRSWRMALLQQFSRQDCDWMAWYLKTPLSVCLQWNQKRDRHVPENIIAEMYQHLQDFPPIIAEGFAAVTTIQNAEFDSHKIQQKITSLPRSLTNRNNRTQNEKIEFHAYSSLLDFERLMHLIALLIEYPGLGTLQENSSEELLKVLGEVPQFPDSLAEITTVLEKLKGKIYADRKALTEDLHFLEENGLLHQKQQFDQTLAPVEIQILPCSHAEITAHTYSDIKPFKRLLTVIRLILNQPFLTDTGKGSLKTLAKVLSQQSGIEGDCYHQLRKDIEKVLKPYNILPPFSLKQGYFAGTGILSRSELKQIFGILQTHAKSIEDPIALETYQLFSERMALSDLDGYSPYPVRAIAHRCIVNSNHLHSSVLLCNLRQVEEIIESGELVKLGRLAGRGRFPGDREDEFLAWPLQIVFYRFAWYLGFEHEGGSQPGLLRFERLDRLFLGRRMMKTRSREEQEISLRNLQRLLEASPVIFLGRSAIEQQKFLSRKPAIRSEVEVKIELWFDDETFRFISEGTKRFPLRQMKMSPPLSGPNDFTGRKKFIFFT